MYKSSAQMNSTVLDELRRNPWLVHQLLNAFLGCFALAAGVSA
jgi:hypothetical protein